MNERIREQLHQIKQQIADAIRKLLMHPQSEELYNRWLQYPEKTRQRALMWTKGVAGFIVLTQLFVGTWKLARNEIHLWKGHRLLEALASYQIESAQLQAEKQSLSNGAGLFTGTIQELINPLLTNLQIQPNLVRYNATPDIKKEHIRIVQVNVDFDRLTTKQLVEILFHIESGGPNLSAHNLSMTLIDRGWYKTSFQIHQALPKGKS